MLLPHPCFIFRLRRTTTNIDFHAFFFPLIWMGEINISFEDPRPRDENAELWTKILKE